MNGQTTPSISRNSRDYEPTHLPQPSSDSRDYKRSPPPPQTPNSRDFEPSDCITDLLACLVVPDELGVLLDRLEHVHAALGRVPHGVHVERREEPEQRQTHLPGGGRRLQQLADYVSRAQLWFWLIIIVLRIIIVSDVSVVEFVTDRT